MGCYTSRLDNEEVVMLCKERKRLIRQAMEQRYTLAEAHVSYIKSLKSIGVALCEFAEVKNITLGLDNQQPCDNNNPVLTLPTSSKTTDPLPIEEPNSSSSPPKDPSSSPSTTTPQENDHHDNPCCSDDNGSSSSSSTSTSCTSTPSHCYDTPHYLRSHGNPTVSVEERHRSPETMRMNSFVMPQYAPTDFFIPPELPTSSYNNRFVPREDPNEAPPPPSPPRTFAWDFFNPFTPLETHFVIPQEHRPMSSHSSEIDLKQVREEEGIPDLEDEAEIKNEMQVEEKRVETASCSKASSSSSSSDEEVEGDGHGNSSCMENQGCCGDDSEGDDSDEEKEKLPILEENGSCEVVKEDKKEEDVQVEVANSVSNEVVSGKKDLTVVDSGRSRNLIDVMKDIEDQFTRAYVSGKPVSRMLEANQVQYHSGLSEIKEHSTKVLHAITWHKSMCSPSSLSKCSFSSKAYVDEGNNTSDDENGMMSGSHSSTLERLYAWEKKLYDEVKAGERTRIIYERKCMQLRSQDAKGEDPQTVDKTRAAIKDLHTRIRVAIQAVDSVSKKIQKLRDEELQPQLEELLQGLMHMWKVMLESHETQNQIISEAKFLANSSGGEISRESHRRATLKLESELQRWQTSFTKWIAAQKSYVQSLYGWLLKCVIQEPEVSMNGRIPFSPRRLGAPPIFSVCKDWVLVYEKLPDSSVIFSIRGFAGDMRCLLEQQNEEEHQKWKADRLARDLDRRVNSLQRFEHRIIELQISSMEKCELGSRQPTIPICEHITSFRSRVEEEQIKHRKVIEQTRYATLNALHNGLKLTFEALTEFATESLKSYEELCRYNNRESSVHMGSDLPKNKDG